MLKTAWQTSPDTYHLRYFFLHWCKAPCFLDRYGFLCGRERFPVCRSSSSLCCQRLRQMYGFLLLHLSVKENKYFKKVFFAKMLAFKVAQKLSSYNIGTEYVKSRVRTYLSRTLIFPVVEFVFQVMLENISNTLKASIRKCIRCKWILEHNIQFWTFLCVILYLRFSENS